MHTILNQPFDENHPAKPMPIASQQGEEKFRAIFDNAIDAMVISNDYGQYLDVNLAACNLFGLARAQLVGRYIGDFVDLDYDLPKAWTEFQKAGHLRAEIRLTRLDGQVRYAEAASTANILPGQHLAVLRDITQRKQTERQLSEIENRYASLVELLPAVTYIAELEPMAPWYFVSRHIEKLLGFSPETWLANPALWYQRLHPDDRDRILVASCACQISGQAFCEEYRLLTRDGRVIWCRDEGIVLPDGPDGKSLMQGFIFDITERKQAEEILKESEERHRFFYENNPIMCFTLNTEGIILSVNQFGMAQLGYQSDEMVGKSVLDIFYPEDRATALAQLELSLLNPTVTHSWELRKVCKDGSVIWVREIDRIVTDIQGQTLILIACEDITEQKEAQDALYRSEQHLTLHVQQTPLGVIEWGLNCEVIAWNPGAEAIFGFRRAEILGQQGSKLLLPESAQQQVAQAWQDLLTQQGGTRVTNENITKTGQVILCDWYNTPLVDNDGQVIGVASLVQDITERQQAQQALSQSEERYRKLMETAKDAILIANGNTGLIIAANLQAEQLLKRPVSQILGRHQLELHPLHLRQSYQELFDQHMTDGGFVGEILIQDAQGQQITVEASSSIFEVDGVPFIQGIFRDITERKQTELALRQTEEKYRSIFEHIVEGIFQTSPEGRYLSANPALARIYGYDSPHDLSTRISNIATDVYVDPQRRAQFVTQIAVCDRVANFESEVRRVDGVIIWVSENTRAVRDEQGVLLYYEGTLEDITARKRAEYLQQAADQQKLALERATIQMEELKKLNQLKDDFLSTVSHELRTPMTNIKMAIHLLQGTAPERQAAYIKILDAECRREIQLINDLLDLQRLEAGTKQLSLEIIDLRCWLDSLLTPFYDRCQERQQNLQVIISPELTTLRTDSQILERGIVELLNNACKYTRPHGLIELKVMSGISVIIFEVTNFGTVIPAHELSRIFEKFYRIPNSDPWGQGGTGLGLALVKRIVEQLAGIISVESENGKTTFTVVLPLESF